MARKRASITLSVAEREKARLEALALALGQTWGDRPNVSKLIKAIARGELQVALNNDWSRDRIDTLYKALNRLKDSGHFNEALTIAQLLLERSEINLPLREKIQAWVDTPGVAWRSQLDEYCRQQRPFRLAYQDAAERIWGFTVRHAEIVLHEDRHYLDCWCDETEGNRDVEGLRHNWSLRLDRVPDEVVLSPVSGHWQPEPGFLDVEFYLLNRLALGYRTKTKADLINEWLPEQQVRRVVRRIYNTFWFFREVRRYGADCKIVGPDEVRDRFVEELKETIGNYREYVD